MRPTLIHTPIRVLAALVALALCVSIAPAQDDPAPTDPAPTERAPTERVDTPADEPQAAPVLRPRVFEPAPEPWAAIEDPARTIRVVFTPLGAGVERIEIVDETVSIESEDPVVIQRRRVESGVAVVPFAVRGVRVDGETIELAGAPGAPVWREKSPGVFEALLENAQGNPVLRLERRYTIREGRHGFVVDQTFENLTPEPREVVFFATAMVDLDPAQNAYAGDRRRVRRGFYLPPETQGASALVRVDDDLAFRTSLLGSKETTPSGATRYPDSNSVWPTEKSLRRGERLSWLALTDRYHAVAIHPVLDPSSAEPSDRLLSPAVASMDRIVLNPFVDKGDTVMVLTTRSDEITVEPGTARTLTHGVYAGPRTKPLLVDDPVLSSLNLPEMVVFNLGGFCAACTFDWLTQILIAVLRVFHAITLDWGLAIMLLVVLVRSCLHPVTRWSQIRMQRFGVQMQSMAPKQKELKEKFKDDPKKMQQEMTKLWREEGISPLGMLGCLPMLLQSPVWIALYATLFYAYDLRQQPAFYGVFQNITGGSWMFLADLSRADAALPLPEFMHFSFPLWGTVSSVNLLPVLMGVVFFIHQKYMTPPTQTTMTPEQESTQKMMKVMMVVMFPVIMYTAPSGLALYFITNSTLGIFESKWIRAHMKKHGMLEIENIRAQNAKKGPGFLQRLTQAAEAQRELKAKGPSQPNPGSRHPKRPR